MTNEERNALIESYGQAANRVEAALAGFPREMWRYKPAPNSWSIHEQIVHLADSEANSYVRARRFIAEPGSGVYAYEQDVWAEKLDYHRQNADQALALFRLLRESTYELIRNQPDSVWQHTIIHSENGLTTFDGWLKIYEAHTHIDQMRRVYDYWLANGKPLS